MFSKRSCKPCMKGSFSGGRVLTGSFISDQCLWGALVDLQGAGVSAFSPCLSPSFSRCLVHSPCMPGWPVSWAHPPDPAERTIMHYETEGTEYATKNNSQHYLFCIRKLPLMYFCVKKWLQYKYMQGKCGTRCFIWALCRTSSGKQRRTKSLIDKWGE